MGDSAETAIELSFRPGRTEDWPQVAPIVERTWDEEGDYIREALWQQWAADTVGCLLVATRVDQIVGLCKVSQHGPAEWWFEGLRVHPQHRRQGIARALTEQALKWFRTHGSGIARMAIYSDNEPSQRLARAFGFRHTLSYTRVETNARPADYRNFRVMASGNLPLITAYLRRSPMHRVNRFAEHYWKLYYLTHDRLAAYLADAMVQVLGWRQFDALHGLAVLFTTPPPAYALAEDDLLYVGYLDAPDDTTLRAMLAALRGLALRRGLSKVMWMMPTGMGLERLIGNDVRRVWDGALMLFELPLRVAQDIPLS